MDAPKKISQDDLRKALNEVIYPEDEVIVIYSGIWSFGYRLNCSIPEIPDMILDTIEEVVGDDRTLLMPSFTSREFTKTRKFDIVRSSRTESGIVSDTAIKRKNYCRTPHPLHSFVIKGPKANNLLKAPIKTSWGSESVLAWIAKNNARICPMGLPWNKACSYFHRMEEVLQVPFRYYKRFSGTLYEDGKEIGPCQEVKYSYPLTIPFKYDYSVVIPELRKMNAIRSCLNPLIQLESAVASDIDKACHKVLQADPYAIVINKVEVEDWVTNGKEDEINNLSENQRYH